jgi:hypothetical protein
MKNTGKPCFKIKLFKNWSSSKRSRPLPQSGAQTAREQNPLQSERANISADIVTTHSTMWIQMRRK